MESGATNAGRPLMLEGELVPPLLLGLPGDNTFSNYAEANRAFWRQTVLPLVARVQKSFQAWLQPGFGPFRLDYNADRLEALASERRARVGNDATRAPPAGNPNAPHVRHSERHSRAR